MRTDAAVRGLHFVGDADAARGAHVPVDLGEITGWIHDLPGDTGTAFGDEATEAGAARAELIDRLRDGVRVLRADVPVCVLG